MDKLKQLIKLSFLMGIVALFLSGTSISVKADEEIPIGRVKLMDNSSTENLTNSQNLIEQLTKTEIASETYQTEPNETLSDEVTIVSNWKEFVTAFKDNTVTHIEFANDISYGTGGSDSIPSSTRKTSLVIDGKNYAINMADQRLQLDRAASDTPEITVENFSDVKLNNMVYHDGFVYSSMSYWHSTHNSTWTINFSNIKNQTGQTSRIADNSGGQVNFTGDVLWYCEQELMTTSGVNISEGVNVSSYKKNNGSQSFIWFDRPPAYKKDSDAGTDDMVIGKNASFNCKLDGTGYMYPAVFSFYKNFILEEGATFNATMPGAAYGVDYEASNFIAKGNNKINLTSTRLGFPPISFTSKNNRKNPEFSNNEEPRNFYVGPGSELYVIAKTNNSLFDTTPPPTLETGKYIGNFVNITIDSPKYLDLRNSSNTTTDSSSILEQESGVGSFSILNSDLNIWKISDEVTANAPYSFSTVEKITQSGRKSSNNLAYSSSDSGVEELLPLSTIRRISALNENPTLNFIDVTNAQKSISYKTILGQFPDANGMDDEGNINYEPVYPLKGRATADITDTKGVVHSAVPSGEAGVTTITMDDFNEAGEYTKGIAHYGKRTQDEATKYKVWDVVPPEPAVITSTDIAEGVTSLSGTGEVGATVYLEIDGTSVDSATTKVDSDGNWTLNFDGGLSKVGSTAQIFLEDTAGKADITDPPATNNESGNINPKEDMMYQDATFKAATKVEFTKSQFTIEASDFSVSAKSYPKTDDELVALILKKSNAKLTNDMTGEELDSSNISVDYSQMPSTAGADVARGQHKVGLSYTRGASTFQKEITVTIDDSSMMSIKQVYKGTDTPIYSDIENKTQVDNTKSYEVDSGSTIEDVMKRISEDVFKLNYDGYNSLEISDYKVYQEGKEITPTPTKVPDKDFTVVYEYEGQLKFKDVATNLDFGSIALTADSSSTELTESSDKQISIINTVLDSTWTLKASIPNGIRQTTGKNKLFLGKMVYKNSDGTEQIIDSSLSKLETQKDDSLYSKLNLKNEGNGLFLQQKVGNLKGSYKGTMIWTLEDTP